MLVRIIFEILIGISVIKEAINLYRVSKLFQKKYYDPVLSKVYEVQIYVVPDDVILPVLNTVAGTIFNRIAIAESVVKNGEYKNASLDYIIQHEVIHLQHKHWYIVTGIDVLFAALTIYALMHWGLWVIVFYILWLIVPKVARVAVEVTTVVHQRNS